jgi:hypothetical protein
MHTENAKLIMGQQPSSTTKSSTKRMNSINNIYNENSHITWLQESREITVFMNE